MLHKFTPKIKFGGLGRPAGRPGGRSPLVSIYIYSGGFDPLAALRAAQPPALDLEVN